MHSFMERILIRYFLVEESRHGNEATLLHVLAAVAFNPQFGEHPIRLGFLPQVPTHIPTHNSATLHVVRRTYAAVRDLQVVGSAG